MRVILKVVVVSVLLLLPAAAFAQGSIIGVARDTSGGVLPGVTVEADIRPIFDVLENDAALSETFAEMARGIAGGDNVVLGGRPNTGSEDFADMLRAVPGAYFTIGHEGTGMLHNPAFTFDDAILPLGSSLLARLVETRAAA